jgi:hypothetical protein
MSATNENGPPEKNAYFTCSQCVRLTRDNRLYSDPARRVIDPKGFQEKPNS